MRITFRSAFFTFSLLLVLLGSCAPAPTPIIPTNSPIPPTITSTLTPNPTNTPIPTNTSEPTATEMPCTDMGWSDIDGSLFYFVAEVKNLDKMKSVDPIMISVDVNYLEDMIDGVNGIEVATCSQNVKDLVLAGMNAYLTYCQELSSYSLDQAAYDAAKAKLTEDRTIFFQANAELSELGYSISNLEYLANRYSK